ncbi:MULTISPECIES: hypothetical protein [Streptococcus]|uniref:Folylpolyglutamate synthase n=1 Tax=Streptococcus suis TaxID=1307 RepID=A0A0Z8LE43_STRSU|nr:hypothetical protein [Streptococcus suis]MCK3976379.1 hypothetical protein [Streptococcus suis]MDW8575710.1 hypothetical protein [Streptococcus suis]MDW8589648.1 hypothetical protein [Streptococcus suis]MDW8615612.1 hypothetical protein [Streptococcus suis]NQG68567.1 hypothetical protein [Streptococcus suis]
MLENWLNTKQCQVFHYMMERIEYALGLLGNVYLIVKIRNRLATRWSVMDIFVLLEKVLKL